MTLKIIDWNIELLSAKKDNKVGIQIATLLESQDGGTYITIIPPGSSVKPHYHNYGDEEYHIIGGSGTILLLPVSSTKKDLRLVSKQVRARNSFIIPPKVIHQLINDGDEPLTLIFSCPLSHLNEDRVVVENMGKETD